ncbi:penicillin-binding protein activator LpoB [Candidatus Nitrospira salsa]|nr:MAG: hypothetical protein NPIRA01_05660 [Nitrospirales bacterium]
MMISVTPPVKTFLVRSGSFMFILLLLFSISACGSEKKVTRVDTGLVTDFSGRWNDTDSRMVAETMIKEMISRPWLENFSRAKGRQPVVIVGSVLNKSNDHINVQTFITDLEREMTNSQRVTFVAAKSERDEIREERRDQAVHSREDTQKGPGQEIGADFMMKGYISNILDEADGTKAVYYQVDLDLIDLKNNVKSWYGQKKIKKIIEKKRFLF